MDNKTETIATHRIAKIKKTDGMSSDHMELLKSLSLKPRDRYKFIRTIGIGGMKTVLLVHDSDTNRDVALAMMPDFRERSDYEVEKFIKEAQIAAKLEHPHIVPIHDIGMDLNQAPYFVMTYLTGMMLSTLLTRMRNNDEDILKFYHERKMLTNFQKICHAVEFAHSQNILHLDLKPANVHIGKFGEVQLLDWGLASFMVNGKGVSFENKKNSAGETGLTSGTPGYMSPEQVLGDFSKLDVRSDVYSLGAILFAILNFKSPAHYLPEASVKELMKKTLSGAIIDNVIMKNDIRSIRPELEAICRKAMARNPEARYQTVKALRDDVGKYLANFPTEAEMPAAPKKFMLLIKRNSHLFILLGGVIIGFLIALGIRYLLFEDFGI